MPRRPHFALSAVALLSLALAIGCTSETGGVGSIEGTVIDADDQPIAGMRVAIASGTVGFPEQLAVTNDTGYYLLGSIPAGTFEVAVHDEQGEQLALGSATVAAGKAAKLDFTVAVAESGPSGRGLTEEQFAALLKIQDVKAVLVAEVELHAVLRDMKAMAEATDPAQVAAVDSFYSMTFEVDDGSRGLTFSVIDYKTPESANDDYVSALAETPGMIDLTPPVGETAAIAEINTHGIGSVIMFTKGDKLVQLHTIGEDPFVDAEGLKTLAREVADRL